MFQKGDLCKHFKGKTLIEKNIYRVLEVGVSYTGTCKGINDKLVIYCNIFQDGKVFAREERELIEEIDMEKQIQFHQKHRVEKLTEEEIKEVQTEQFRKAKMDYIRQKEEACLQIM